MKVKIDVRRKDINIFEHRVQAIIENVFTGSKASVNIACKEIMEESQIQVPKGTMTLAASGFYEVVKKKAKIGYWARIGYGNDTAVNPITGLLPSMYMVKVHEDTTANYKEGKAKYLEDPIREYALQFESAFIYQTKQALLYGSVGKVLQYKGPLEQEIYRMLAHGGWAPSSFTNEQRLRSAASRRKAYGEMTWRQEVAEVWRIRRAERR